MTTIASFVVRAAPSRLSDVREALARMPGVSIEAVTPDGRLAVVIEDVPDRAALETCRALSEIGGVISSLPAFQYSDDPLPQERST